MEKVDFERLKNEVEKPIFPLLHTLNKKGFLTYSSCGGHQICEGELVSAGFGDDDKHALRAQTDLFSVPFVAFANRLHHFGDIAEKIDNAIPELEICLQRYNKAARTPWMLESSGWNFGAIDTLKPDIELADGYEGGNLVIGDYWDLVHMWEDIVNLSYYLRRELKAIL